MSAAFLAKQLDTWDALLILTDADAVPWLGQTNSTRTAQHHTKQVAKFTFDAELNGAKNWASCEFIQQGGKVVGIGALEMACKFCKAKRAPTHPRLTLLASFIILRTLNLESF